MIAPYSESLFGTLKSTPAFPDQPFASLEAARGVFRSWGSRAQIDTRSAR
jgi:hypothetical protein